MHCDDMLIYSTVQPNTSIAMWTIDNLRPQPGYDTYSPWPSMDLLLWAASFKPLVKICFIHAGGIHFSQDQGYPGQYTTPSARNLDVSILVTSQNSVNCQTYWWYDIRNEYWTINDTTMISFSQMDWWNCHILLGIVSRCTTSGHERQWLAYQSILCRTLNSVSQHKNTTATQQHLMNTYPYHALLSLAESMVISCQSSKSGL